MHYDAVVAGGSISGLMAAREIAAKGLSVLVLEEDMEIGTPEHCGGMISLKALRDLGILPANSMLLNNVKRARIYSPSGKSFTLNAEKQRVVAIDRRRLDKHAAKQAMKNGAEVWLRCSMLSFKDEDGYVSVETTNGRVDCSIMVDARGCKVMMQRNREGALPSAQYEIYAEWLEEDTVEVYFDNERYPGFFSWFIPTGNNTAKAGVAGKGINPAEVLDRFLLDRKHAIMRKIFSPIWVLGPLDKFVQGRIVTVGDAAGQTKPTTAGGIYSCGLAGILAGRAIADALLERDLTILHRYEEEWFKIFGSEFERMLLVRKVFDRLDNKALDEIFEAIPSEVVNEVAASGDFDYHSKALTKLLGVESTLKIAKSVLGNEIRRLFSY